MSVFDKLKPMQATPNDEVYIIYGDSGSGKTTLASTFPHDEKNRMLIIDIMEGGENAIAYKDQAGIDVIPCTTFDEVETVVNALLAGYYDDGESKVPFRYRTIVIDSGTNLQELAINAIKEAGRTNPDGTPKATSRVISLQQWGFVKNDQCDMFTLYKKLFVTTGSIIVSIYHAKSVKDEENPGNNKIVPSVMGTVASSICAKASYVWYTKVEHTQIKNPETNEYENAEQFVTYIGPNAAYLTKCRAPKGMTYPTVIANLTYDKWKKHILDKMKASMDDSKPVGIKKDIKPVVREEVKANG